MFRLAWRQLQLDPLRSLLTAIALGSVIAVILILEGFEQGQYYQLERLILNRKSDLIATQAGVRNCPRSEHVPPVKLYADRTRPLC